MDVLGIRRWWLIPAAVGLGALVGILVSLVSSTSRRADASVLISSPRGPTAVTPFLPNLRELAKSGVLAGNVRSTLRLQESVAELRDHLDSDVRPQSQVIVISARDEDAEKARQIAQEAAVVFTQLVESRFGERSPPLQAALIDSAHVRSAANRHFIRNALIGAVVGLLAGMLGTLLLQGGRVGEGVPGAPERAVLDVRRRESQLEQRVKTVSARERELAKRAGQLASREHDLEQRVGQLGVRDGELARRADQLSARERELAQRADDLGAREGELTKQVEEVAVEKRELELRPVPETPRARPEPALGPERVAPTVVARAGSWNINDLEHAVGARADASPEQAEEWRTYLFFLRQHASSDGLLPPQFDGLVAEVFADLLD